MRTRYSSTATALNQVVTEGPATLNFDDNGDLTSDGTNLYGWDAEKRLTNASTAGEITLTYDPLGRLYQTPSPVFGSMQIVYGGAHSAVDYVGSMGWVRHRCVYGRGPDKPILHDEARAFTAPYLPSDYQRAAADNDK